MKRNVGTVDMIGRIVIACVLFYIGFFDNPIVSEGTPKTIVGFIAFLPLLTGLLRYCPLYSVIGMDTSCKCGDGEEKE